MLKILKDIGLAMINATLILIVVALFLAWKVTGAADQIAANFAQNLVTVQPIREDIQGATTELAAIRSDLAAIAEQSGTLQSASLKRIETRLNQMDANMQTARQSLSDLSQAPVKLVDHAIDRAADRLAQNVRDLRRCVPEG